MKVAFDVHGVLDSVEYFRNLSRTHKLAGDEVYIISGQKWDTSVLANLTSLNVSYDRYISIVDWLGDTGTSSEPKVL